MSKNIIKNDYSLNLINKIYTILLGLLSSAFSTRYLGIELKGEYSYITQIVLVLTIIFNLGIHQSYSYFYKKSNGSVFEKYISIYLYQFIYHSILAILLIILLKKTFYIYAIIMLPFSVIYQQIESTMAVENIRLKIKLHMFNATIRMISFFFMFLYLETSLFPPVLLTIIINIISVLVYLFFSKCNYKNIKKDKVFTKKVISYSWIPMLTALLITLNYSVDVFFLKHLGTSIELGLYSTAVGIVNYFWLIPDSFKEVLLSKIARDYSIKSTMFAIKISVFSVIIIIMFFIIFGKFAISLLYGTDFLNAYLVTIILSFGAVSMVYYKMIGVILLSEGKRWIYFFSLLISVIINVISNIILIPIFGMYGAACSSVLSYSICGFSFLLYFIREKSVKVSNMFLFEKSEISIFFNKINRK